MLFLLREPASFHIHHEAGGKALYIEQDLNKTLRYQSANSFWATHKWTLFKRGQYSTEFYNGRLRPTVQPLTLRYG